MCSPGEKPEPYASAEQENRCENAYYDCLPMVAKKRSWIPTYLTLQAPNVSEKSAEASKERREESNNSQDASNEARECDQYPSHPAILCFEPEDSYLMLERRSLWSVDALHRHLFISFEKAWLNDPIC